MSSPTASYALSAFSFPGLRGSDFQARRYVHTLVILSDLDSNIAEAISIFDKTEDKPFAVKATNRVTAYPQNAVEAVEFISKALLIPQGETLAGVGISERTFFGWKATGGRLPRKQSLGRVWSTTRVIAGLMRANPNLASWYHESEEAQRLFASGDIHGLIACEAKTHTLVDASEPREYGLLDDRFLDDQDD